MLLLNPVVIGVIVMCTLCLLRFNILLAILISALIAGVSANIDIITTINILIKGMQGNLETALSYILLGALAAAIAMSNLTAILIHYVSQLISKKNILVCAYNCICSMLFTKFNSGAYCIYSYSYSATFSTYE